MSYAQMSYTPFERDIDDQGEALRAFARSPVTARLGEALNGRYDRVVLTGMGSSHFAALPSWRRLVAQGRPAWWVDSGQLLDSPELITPATLLIVTSQSGASGEVVELLKRRDAVRPAALVGITNDPHSPLGEVADAVVELCSGPEATVSTKSYLNSLAAHQRIVAHLAGLAEDDAEATIETVEAFARPSVLADLAGEFAAAQSPRLAFVGFADHAATALYAGLITKEASKIPAEGFIGGQFRHGPLELAGPGLIVVLFGGGEDDPARSSLRQLATDLRTSGSTVLSVGELGLDGVPELVPNSGSVSARLAHGGLVAQHFAVQLAAARGLTPGAFHYGSKITSAL